MKIKLNGKEINFNGKTLLDILNEFNLESDHIVIEKNRDIVHRENFKTEAVNDGDVIEIITFVGGG